MAVIKSLLDTDLYKFTTGYAYAKLFPYAFGHFKFIDRNNRVYPQGFDDLLRREVEAMSQIVLSEDEASFITSRMPYIPPTHVDMLRGFRFNPNELSIKMDKEGHLEIDAIGPLYRVTLWETPILALVSQLYYEQKGIIPDAQTSYRAIQKAQTLEVEGVDFSLFGMRRRFSYEIEDLITQIMKEYAPNHFFGTSNVHFAHKYGLNVSGTHPHEWIQFHGATYGYKMANYMAMENWINVYDGDLGTVLTDTYTTDVFFSNFSKKHALLYTSLRHDSGDPFRFVERAIERYKDLRVDPKIKYIIFSDGLNIERALQIKRYCADRIRCSFGIGTNLTNDTGAEPANIVMKLWRCKMTEKERWRECVKLSDAKGKYTGSQEEIALACRTLDIETQS